MEAVLWSALLFLLLIFLVYKYGTRTHGTLERLGIPVIPPYPFIGSIPFPWTVVGMQEDMKNASRYGRVWGQYDGPTPVIFISDVELAKRIMIKDFDHFADRPILFDFELGRDQMDMMPAAKWKPVRAIVSPCLVSGAKLKTMMPTMLDCAADAARRLDSRLLKSSTVDAQVDLFGPLTLDIMTQFSFGIRFPDVDNPNSMFVKSASAFGSPGDAPDKWTTWFFTAFPALGSYMAGRELIPAMRYFLEILRRQMKQRRAEGVARADLVGALMDAVDNKVPTAEFRALGITEENILLQGAEMLMAAYDTVGTTLNKAAYFLAKHPAIQDRIVEEVQAAGELTYESLHKMPLLEATVREVLRMSPLISRHYRLCLRDWQSGDGVNIPAGMCVILPLWPYHFDPEVFSSPEQFLPDRWLGEQGAKLGQYSWMPFGLGPRACIGSRLGMMESKFALAFFLTRYRISATPQTKLEYVPGYGLFASSKPIMVKVEKRAE